MSAGRDTAMLLQVQDLAQHFRVARPGLGFGARATLRAVDGVSFSIGSGRTLGLVGESGCGKSTTARAVLGLAPLTRGAVHFDGEPVDHRRNARWREQRRAMQMVYQDPLGALDRRLPVMAQVIEPLQIFGLGTPAERVQLARDLMAGLGLSSALASRRPMELSGGQRQRVVLARALILRPRLLVCDEPVSALDVSIQAQVVELLNQVRERFELAMLFISHDLKVVRQTCDEVAVMYLGRIVEQAPADALFAAPLHPYTQALVAAVPRLREAGGAAARVLLQGDPPDPTAPPAGCAFHPRCVRATPRCRVERPELLRLPGGAGERTVACHEVTEGASA